jgi:YesN/AraC family two-component response regulator
MVCNDSRKATDIIHHFQPGLVFLDIQMPHLSGFELHGKNAKQKFQNNFYNGIQ